MQAKGVADAGAAAFRVSGLELGGLFGSLLAGRISDYLIAKNPEGGNVGKRVQVVMGYTVGIAAMLATFYLAPASAGWLQWASVFMIGFFLYGPQVLLQFCSAHAMQPAWSAICLCDWPPEIRPKIPLEPLQNPP